MDSTREKLGQPTDLQLLQKTFDRMRRSEWSPREAVRHGQAKRGRRPRTGTFESIDSTREKLGQPSDLQLLQKTFDRMK